MSVTFASPNVTTVPISGEFSLDQAIKLREEVLSMIDQGTRNITFNLTGVSHLDSAGLGVMVTIYKRISSLGGQCKVQGAPEKIQELFAITRLSNVFGMN